MTVIESEYALTLTDTKRHGGNNMTAKENTIGVQTAQHADKDLLAGLSKTFDRFTKTPVGVQTVDDFELKETAIGTTQAYFRLSGRNVRLNISPLQGVGHMVAKKDGTSFFKIEPTERIKGLYYKSDDGYAVSVETAEDIKPILSSLEFGKDITVEMDNGFVFNGKVCDINRTDRFQFFKLIEQMADRLGVTVGKAIVDGQVVSKAVLKDGKPVSSGELMNLFANCGGASVKCAFSVNNYTGKTSVFDIGGHKE